MCTCILGACSALPAQLRRNTTALPKALLDIKRCFIAVMDSFRSHKETDVADVRLYESHLTYYAIAQKKHSICCAKREEFQSGQSLEALGYALADASRSYGM